MVCTFARYGRKLSSAPIAFVASSATNQTGCNKLRSLLKFAWIPLVVSEVDVIKMTISRFLKWKKEEVV